MHPGNMALLSSDRETGSFQLPLWLVHLKVVDHALRVDSQWSVVDDPASLLKHQQLKGKQGTDQKES